MLGLISATEFLVGTFVAETVLKAVRLHVSEFHPIAITLEIVASLIGSFVMAWVLLLRVGIALQVFGETSESNALLEEGIPQGLKPEFL